MAAAVKNFTLNISGTVTYNTNTWASFGVWYDGQNEADLSGSATAFRSIFNTTTKAAQVRGLLALLSPASLTFTNPSVPTAPIVTAVQMIISGTVAYVDNTWDDFSFECRDDGSTHSYITSGNLSFDHVAANIAGNAELKSAFSSLLSPTAVTVSA